MEEDTPTTAVNGDDPPISNNDVADQSLLTDTPIVADAADDDTDEPSAHSNTTEKTTADDNHSALEVADGGVDADRLDDDALSTSSASPVDRPVDDETLAATQLAEQQRTIFQLEESIESADKDRRDLLDKLATVTEKCANENITLNRRIMTLESDAKAQADRSAALENHHAKTMRELNNKCKRDVEELSRSTKTAKSEKDMAVIKYAQREAQIMKGEAEIANLAAKVAKLTNDTDALQKLLRGQKNEKSEAEKCVDAKEHVNADLVRDLDNMKMSLQESEARCIVANKNADDAVARANQQREDLVVCEKRVQSAKEEASVARGECTRLGHEIQRGEQRARERDSEANDQLELHTTILGELDALKSLHKESLTTITSLTHDHESKSFECERLTDEIVDMLHKTALLNDDVERMTPMCDQVDE